MASDGRVVPVTPRPRPLRLLLLPLRLLLCLLLGPPQVLLRLLPLVHLPLTARHRSPPQVALPTPSRTKWIRRVPHPVLIGHAASLSRRGLQEKPEGVENEAVEQVVFADKARARPEAGAPC